MTSSMSRRRVSRLARKRGRYIEAQGAASVETAAAAVGDGLPTAGRRTNRPSGNKDGASAAVN
jgi:hypothetical protein